MNATDLPIPDGIRIRPWTEADFPAVQEISRLEGWPTPIECPAESLASWKASHPALVMVHGSQVIGFLRALSDENVTTYVCEMTVIPAWRGRGLGAALLDACQRLVPSTRLDLLSTAQADGFYQAIGFRPFPGFRRSSR